jgi:hypothetical protein
MPLPAPNEVVGRKPAPAATPGMLPALIRVLTVLTKALTPAVFPAVLAPTAQFAALVMSLMMTASERPPPKSRGLARYLSSETFVLR